MPLSTYGARTEGNKPKKVVIRIKNITVRMKKSLRFIWTKIEKS